MKLLDVNLLIYAVDQRSARHGAARAWLEHVVGGSGTVALPWTVLAAFVRLTTNPRVVVDPLSVGTALDVVDGWLARPNVVAPAPTDRHAAVLRELLAPFGAGAATSSPTRTSRPSPSSTARCCAPAMRTSAGSPASAGRTRCAECGGRWATADAPRAATTRG